ncbi:General transcription factor 3C polypeptide 4 [Holothuria leucospilota]|uniref:General transcription factor 3C polypeptide 4 n=1 Tax=Holothuria leucospilota TaxID=206669 RepID=A0A9Q0YRX3_HOLLE|nr:General transcription factor 3C polypeptide 4 [Holothuria leucospilota]
MKAQHIILFLLSIPTLEEELASPVVLSRCVQNSLHTVPSSGLYSCPSFAISCSQDGSLQKVQPCYANNELSAKVDLFEKHPPIGPAHRGCTMTASGVYLSTLTYNHVARSTNLFLRQFADDTLIIDKLKDRTVPLYLKVDCIEFIRCQYMKGEGTDFPWVSTHGDLQAWLDKDGELDEYRLQMKRYLLIFQHSKLAHITMKKRQGSNNKSDVDGLAKKISDCEEQLMLLRMCSALEKVTSEDVNELSVKLMCDWLRTNQTCYTENVKDLVEKILSHPVIRNMKSSQCHEICYLCGEKILFQNLWEDSCSNGHLWKRCNLTLLLCQIKTRSCSWCTSKSLYPTDEDCSWVRTLLKQQCVFCSGVYVHQSAT